MSLISCSGLSLSYDGRRVLSELTFTVERGDYLCIVGENGSGKSTLIKALLGLKTPAAGTIRFGEGLKSSEIGYLPQKTEAQSDFPASVFEVVLSGRLNARRFSPFYSKEDKAEAAEQLARLGIASLRSRSFSELSGGQQQRVLLARALCATKKLILLDEPVAGLDPEVSREFYSIIRSVNAEGITVIMVSHDLVPALHAATAVLRLDGGHCRRYRPEEFLASLAERKEEA